ncbi:MAG TPA: sulfatase-like hydrolase/transferase [Burkholderiales bacterium]
MTAARWGGLAPTEPAGALALLFLVFPGGFLPIDVIYAAPGVMAYAMPNQAARIYLYALVMALLASVVCCLACLAMGRRKGTFAALWLGVALAAFAVGHGLLLWSSHYIAYDPELRWLRMLVLLAACVAIGWRVARKRRAAILSAVAASLRAGAALVTLGALAALAVVASAEGDAEIPAVPPSAGKRPSIYLITVDTLSALHMPTYGYARPTAPRLAEFAGGATVFQRNYASANFTTSSVASLLFGVRPWEHRVIQLEGRPARRLFADSLPSLLAQAGYFTASVATNSFASPRHLGIEPQFAMTAKSECFAANPAYRLDTDLQTVISHSLVWYELLSLVMQAADMLALCDSRHFDPGPVFAEARAMLAAAPAGRPVFLWIHLFPPHAPYVTPAPFVGLFNPGPDGRDRRSTTPPNLFLALHQLDFPGALRDRYDESIRYVDHHIGAFLDELKKRGLYDDAIVVISADHGESFTKGYGEHGGPLLHDELVRVPLFIKAPAQRAHRQVSALTELVDIKPTLLELAGIPGAERGEGISLVPLMHGKSIERPVFSMNFQQSSRSGSLANGSVAMILGQWKYVAYFGAISYPYMPDLNDALYDLEQDPWETDNLASAHPEVALRMRGEIEARLGRHAVAAR